MSLPAPIPLNIPLKGLNFKDPLAAMSDMYTPWALNWNPESQSLKVRPGYVQHCTPHSTFGVIGLGVFGSAQSSATHKLYAYVQDSPASKIYDVSTTTPSVAYTAADNDADYPYTAYYAGRLAFAAEKDVADCGAVFDGSTWSAWGFTYAGAAIGGGIVVSYQGRTYIFKDTDCYYSASVPGVTGATNKVSFADFLDRSKFIAWAAVLTSPGERSTETLLAFGGEGGDVLVYSGSYPAAEDWKLYGRFKIAAPLGPNAILSYQNDVWLLTINGVVSLRDLFQNGSRAQEDLSPSAYINSQWSLLWKKAGSPWSYSPVRAAHWPEKNQIYVMLPGFVDNAGTYTATYATMYVYNTITQAWMCHRLESVDGRYVGNLTYYKDNLYFSCVDSIMTIDADGIQDEVYNDAGNLVAYDVPLQSAYQNLGNGKRIKRVHGFEPILRTDFEGDLFGMKAAADFGRRTSNLAKVALTSGYSIPHYGCGVEGSFIQYRFDGYPSGPGAIGLELFSVGALIS